MKTGIAICHAHQGLSKADAQTGIARKTENSPVEETDNFGFSDGALQNAFEPMNVPAQVVGGR